MTCERPLWHPTCDCCCGTELSFCAKWPKIDWGSYTWKMRMPSAASGHERFVQYAFDDGRLEYPRIAIPGNRYSYVGAVALTPSAAPPTPGVVVLPEVFGSSFANWIREGQYRTFYQGNCQWFARCRERLCPGTFALAIMTNAAHNPTTWWPAANVILGVSGEPSTQFNLANFQFGFNVYPAQSANPNFFVGWREVLQAAECVWLPQVRSQGWEYFPGSTSAIDLGLMRRLEIARESLNSPAATYAHYAPNAMEIAVDGLISEGITFGFVSDTRSPLFGQFTIFSGGERLHDFDSEPAEDGPGWNQWFQQSILRSVPWSLTSHATVEPELDRVHRFERTDDNTTLPDWIELELVRI